MRDNTFKNKVKIAMIVLGVYIAVSLITGAALSLVDTGSFGAGFILTAVWMGALGRVIKSDWR